MVFWSDCSLDSSCRLRTLYPFLPDRVHPTRAPRAERPAVRSPNGVGHTFLVPSPRRVVTGPPGHFTPVDAAATSWAIPELTSSLRTGRGRCPRVLGTGRHPNGGAQLTQPRLLCARAEEEHYEWEGHEAGSHDPPSLLPHYLLLRKSVDVETGQECRSSPCAANPLLAPQGLFTHKHTHHLLQTHLWHSTQ